MKFIGTARFVTALLVSIFFAGCSTLQSIDHGLYSAAEALTEQDQVTGKRVISLDDRKAQISKGNDASFRRIDAFRSDGVPLNEEADEYQYSRLQRVFSNVQAVSHGKNEIWTPILVGTNDFNAFTYGGTYFFFYLGMVQELSTDAELANVIGHEMAHSVANHGGEQRSFNKLSAVTGSNAVKREGYQSAFSHEAEAEADRIAILLLRASGL